MLLRAKLERCRGLGTLLELFRWRSAWRYATTLGPGASCLMERNRYAEHWRRAAASTGAPYVKRLGYQV